MLPPLASVAHELRTPLHGMLGLIDLLRAVTPDDVRRVARQYLHDLRLAYIGDPSKLDQAVVRTF